MFAAGTGCSDNAPSIAGVWEADDGSGTKTISDDGTCSGMYYNGSEPLDIGGGMRCVLGSSPDSNGMYSLVVQQPPNERTYRVEFPDDSTMILTDIDVTMTRR